MLTRKRQKPHFVPHSQREATTDIVMITILVKVSTFNVLDNPTRIGGAFLIAVTLVMAPVGTSQTIKPSIFRALGTIAGSVLVIAVFAHLSGLAWRHCIFMVPATSCLNSTTLTQVGELGGSPRRGEATDSDHEREAAMPAKAAAGS